jgi:type IV pilus assembly protein PilW
MIRLGRKFVSTQQGLSLLEILIALSLGAFMLLGVLSLMASVSSTRTKISETSDQIENGRYALQLLSDDIALAGFYGKYHPSGATYTLPDPCAAGSIIADLGFDGDPAGLEIPAPIVAYKSGATLPACIAAEAVAKSEVLVVHRVEPESIAAGAVKSNVPHLQTSDCDTGRQFVLSADKADLNLTLNNCTDLAEVWPYIVRSYFISPCEDCSGGGDGKPTLKMNEFREGTLGIKSLVSGVEDMHFNFGMDLDSDGGPDCYISDPTEDTLPPVCSGPWEVDDWKNWRNVVTVRVSLLVRGLATGGGDAAKTYDLGRTETDGASVRSGPFSDGYKRQVYSTVISIPNIAGVRE